MTQTEISVARTDEGILKCENHASCGEFMPSVYTGGSLWAGGNRKIIVFTDLDGTLLDPRTYSWKKAEAALAALRDREASIILVSSKTLGEMERVYHGLGLSDPFMVENGGGIVSPGGAAITRALLSMHKGHLPKERDGFVLFPLGRPYSELAALVQEISAEIGLPVRGFATMSAGEVKVRTGLNLELAALAKLREFDEPFVVDPKDSDDVSAVLLAASRRGLRIVKGDRFLHLFGHGGKGIAVNTVLNAFRQLYARTISIGLGNSPNDFDFLEKVDVPVLLGFPPGDPGVPPSLAHSIRLRASGPAGWNRAILDLLKGPKGRKS